MPSSNGVSIKLGPFRIRLSKPSYGLRFRERLDTPGTGEIPARAETRRRAETAGDMKEIATADAAMLIAPESKSFVRTLEERHKRMAFFPAVLVVGLVCLFATLILAISGSWAWWFAVVAASGGTAAGGWFVREQDLERKTVCVDYEMGDDEKRLWAALERSLMAIADCRRAWQLTASGEVYDRKYHAGASNLISRKAIQVKHGTPPYFRPNVKLVAFEISGQTLYCTPRYILVYQGSRVGLVPYRDLHVSVGTSRCVEEGGVPGDANVVDTTWRYVNKSGGPDRRFNNNHEIPVCLYGEATLKSSGGLHVRLMFSRAGAAGGITVAIAAVVKCHKRKREQSSVMPESVPNAIVFHCHSCAKRFQVRYELAGKSAKCKACGAMLIVPRS